MLGEPNKSRSYRQKGNQKENFLSSHKSNYQKLVLFFVTLLLISTGCSDPEQPSSEGAHDMPSSMSDMEEDMSDMHVMHGLLDMAKDMDTDVDIDIPMEDMSFVEEDQGVLLNKVSVDDNLMRTCKMICADMGLTCEEKFEHPLFGLISGISYYEKEESTSIKTCEVLPEETTTSFEGETIYLVKIDCYCSQ